MLCQPVSHLVHGQGTVSAGLKGWSCWTIGWLSTSPSALYTHALHKLGWGASGVSVCVAQSELLLWLGWTISRLTSAATPSRC